MKNQYAVTALEIKKEIISVLQAAPDTENAEHNKSGGTTRTILGIIATIIR